MHCELTAPERRPAVTVRKARGKPCFPGSGARAWEPLCVEGMWKRECGHYPHFWLRTGSYRGRTNQARVPTVAKVIQEHIDLLIRPSSGTTRTYQTMLDLHVRSVIGHILVDKLTIATLA